MFVIIVLLRQSFAQGAGLGSVVIVEPRAAGNVLAVHGTDPLTLTSGQTE